MLRKMRRLSNEPEKSPEALLETDDGDYVHIARRKSARVPKEKEKAEVLVVKSALLRITHPAFLALGLVQDGYQSAARPSEARCQGEVHRSPQGAVGWSGHMGPPAGTQRVIWGARGTSRHRHMTGKLKNV